MVGVSTVALIERKSGISRSLFSRYWRDVHGVMAARIPGFDTYTQYHVMPVGDAGSRDPESFEGIAVVTYASEDDRQGLITSAVTKHIHRDEQNVFNRALLYNLAAGADRTHPGRSDGRVDAEFVLVVPAAAAIPLAELVAALHGETLAEVRTYDLTSGDPRDWNDTEVDEDGRDRRLVAVLLARWTDRREALATIRRVVQASGGQTAVYEVEATHVMVLDGKPTPVGLRGLDAVRTIEEAGADNQLQDDVVRAVYGDLGRRTQPDRA
jgi:hypothetical protein